MRKKAVKAPEYTKNIVQVKRDIDGAERVYELPADVTITEGTRLMVEYIDGTTMATAEKDSVEIAADLITMFTRTPLRKVMSSITETPMGWVEETADTAEDTAEAE